jgi:hypothetical protein
MTSRAVQGRRLVALVVLGLALFAGVSSYAAIVAAGGGDHQTADWLISYPGEFLRRGLFGELLLRVTPPGVATLWILFALQVALYLPIVGYLLWFLEHQSWSWSAIALACSPAGLAFIGWDARGGFRKEALGFVALVLLAVVRSSANGLVKAAGLVFSLGVWTLGVFSWESIGFMLPAVLFLLMAGRPLPLGKVFAGIYTGIALVAMGASVVFHGGTDSPARLCAAVVDHGLSDSLCTGAIAWMGRGLSESWLLVQQNLAVHSGYLAMLVLAALPIITTRWLRRWWPWALAMVAGIAPLFALGIDYGRWIHILFLEIAICVMAASLSPAFRQAPAATDADAPVAVTAVDGTELIDSRHWTALSTLLYVCLWGIPHAAPTAAHIAGWPFRGLLATVIGWVQTGLLALG